MGNEGSLLANTPQMYGPKMPENALIKLAPPTTRARCVVGGASLVKHTTLAQLICTTKFCTHDAATTTQVLDENKKTMNDTAAENVEPNTTHLRPNTADSTAYAAAITPGTPMALNKIKEVKTLGSGNPWGAVWFEVLARSLNNMGRYVENPLPEEETANQTMPNNRNVLHREEEIVMEGERLMEGEDEPVRSV